MARRVGRYVLLVGCVLALRCGGGATVGMGEPGDSREMSRESRGNSDDARTPDRELVGIDFRGEPDGTREVLALHDSLSDEQTDAAESVALTSDVSDSAMPASDFDSGAGLDKLDLPGSEIPFSPCGDGTLDPGEECDDGNLDDGDMCSASCTVPDSAAFEVDVGDSAGAGLHGTIWSPLVSPAPLVLLVHGLGCVREVWGPAFFDVITTLRLAGFTVAAYDQRGHGESRHLAFRLQEMGKDVGRVIGALDSDFGGPLAWIDTARPVGLIGHSLGAYMVTIAACQSTGYLADQYDRVGVVLAGAAPDNLPELKEWADYTYGLEHLLNLMIFALSYYQPEGDWAAWWSDWVNSGVGAYDELLVEIYSAQNPIGYAHGNGVATSDSADSLSKPYFVAAALNDTTVPTVLPLSCASDLYNDVTYDAGFLGLWEVKNANTGYFTQSLFGHDIWKDPAAVDFAIGKLDMYLLP